MSDSHSVTNEAFAERLRELRDRVRSLPKRSKQQIEQASQRLHGMSYDFHLGTMDIDMFEITRDELLDETDRIAGTGFEELRSEPNFEEPYRSGDEEEWANYARLSRIELLVDKFELLSRLRSDEPEAWDEVEELYVDD